METQTEIELLKQEVAMLTSTVKEQGRLLRELNLSIAKFKGMVGMAMMVGTLLLAGIKMAVDYFKH
ncbi:MAG: hypothetical protein GY906_15570 [bacterium]|nr:hypothetical protein [bacterium]